MSFFEDFKNRVKSSIDIVYLIGRDIPLHQKGDSYRGTIGKA
jgi:DNA primase